MFHGNAKVYVPEVGFLPMTITRLSTNLTVSLACLDLTTFVGRYRPVHWVRARSLSNTLYWIVRSWLWNYPLMPEFKVWDEGNPHYRERWLQEKVRPMRIGTFWYATLLNEGTRCTSGRTWPTRW